MVVGIIELLIFLCIVGYFFNKKRTLDMVDVISNRVQEAYGSFRFNPGGLFQNEEVDENQSSYMLKRFGEKNRRKKVVEKEQDKKIRDKSLYQLKETPASHFSAPVKPQRGLACKYCVPSTTQSQTDSKGYRNHAIDMLRITAHGGRRNNSTALDWGIYFPYLAHIWRLQKYSYPQVAGTVMKDERMKKVLDEATSDSVSEKRETLRDESNFDEDKYYQEMWKRHEKRANNILIDMRSKISDFLLRITSWLLYKLLPCFLSGVAIQPEQIDMLKSAHEKASGVPLIFLPLHRSHLDYILMSFILLNNDIKSPIVAGGDNLRIPVFGWLLRGLGAFFIKRKIDPLSGKKDIVYRAVLHTYLQKCLAAGHNVEFFIEGGRTRTGKPCMPKSGILSVIVDAYMDSTISDALLVPVSINYEKLVDGNFVYEQLGQRKKPETFLTAATAMLNVLRSNYGLMRIDFNEPFSLRELIKSFDKSEIMNSSSRRLTHQQSSSSLYGTDVVQEEHRILVDNIARHVLFDCSNATSVMTTNVVAFLLLNRYRDGVTLSVLVEALDELRKNLRDTKDIGFIGDSEDVVRYAVNLLGPGLVAKEKRGTQIYIKPVTIVPNVIELSYYSNAVIPHFALESIVITSAVLLKKQNEKCFQNPSVGISREKLVETSLEFCEIMKYEFLLYKPCQNLNSMVEDTIERLVLRQILSQPEQSLNTEEAMLARRIAQQIDYEDYDDEDEYYSRDRYQIINEDFIYLPSEKTCDRILLISVLAPFINTYSTVAFCLNYLLEENFMVESEFVKLCVKEITQRVEIGECKYGESISTDSIKNCLKLFEKFDYIEIQNNKGVRIVQLSSNYDATNEVQNIIENVTKFVNP